MKRALPLPLAPFSSLQSSPRYDSVDALRGLAMVWMTVFHFCFDLSHLGFWPQNFRADPFWTSQRTVIVSLFLFCAGLGQAIALHQGQGWARFGRRWLQIAGCALLVSAGSFVMFPHSFIHFGVLHGMAVMLLIARCTAGRGRWLRLAGVVGGAACRQMGHGCGSGPLAGVAAPPRLAAAGTAGGVEPELLHGAPAGHDWAADGGSLDIEGLVGRGPLWGLQP